ncbi:MAG TPA: carboxymuconolactone decarboxylase family protein [Thermoleophilaceae bacterium]|jgi:AhpD family alkylhydroperoxidase
MGPVAGVPNGLRTPRIAPGSPADIGRVNAAITRVLGIATGGRPPHLFTTLARHRGLFRRWLWFAAALMPGGKLPRADSELLILRVAANCGCEYEWRHHERIALTAGLTAEQIAAAREGEADFSPRQLLLLRAADELHAERELSDETWAELTTFLSDTELIELCMLVGHYEMLAMTLNSLRVEPDVLPDRQPRLAARVLKR